MEQIQLFDIPTPPDADRIRSPKSRKLTHFAVLEKNQEVEAIWGVGRSKDDAKADAIKSFGYGDWAKEYGIFDRQDLEEAIVSGELIITRCTRRLHNEVRQYGGEIAFDYSPEKGACLPPKLGI